MVADAQMKFGHCNYVLAPAGMSRFNALNPRRIDAIYQYAYDEIRRDMEQLVRNSVGPVINHQNLIQVRRQHFTECLMGRVRQISSPVFFRGKSQEKAVGKTIIQTFRAVVDAPFISLDLRNCGR